MSSAQMKRLTNWPTSGVIKKEIDLIGISIRRGAGDAEPAPFIKRLFLA